VRGCEQDFGDAYAAKDPYFHGYFATGFIQYNEATKHFRYVRIDFTRATVIGTNGTTKNKVTGLKEEVLNALGWKNYIIAYTSKNSPKEYEGPQPNPLMPDNYDVGLFGGTDEWRVLMWNLRSMAQATRAAKKRLIRDVGPLIAMINEGRQEF
jgi:hypothetical protein